ncbi:8-oxoguanine DNA glycosylase OGG fold protein [Sphingobium yanoikuyae]|jgi:hypothetical protein
MTPITAKASLLDLTSAHFEKFASLVCKDCNSEEPGGKIPASWVPPSSVADHTILAKEKLSRSEVLTLAQDETAPIDAVCWSILAWGGMDDANRDHLAKVIDPSWLHLAANIKAGKHDRQSAYSEFERLRTQTAVNSDGNMKSKLLGVAPAYFTKLIFFLMPRNEDSQPGYIMDQWAGCSVNLLAGRQVVRMNYSGTWTRPKRGEPSLAWSHRVCDTNNAANYEDFCRIVEEVAQCIKMLPDEAERLMIAGRRNAKNTWRHYLVEHYKPPESLKGIQ